MDDHDVCKAVRAGRWITDVAALTRAEERGLVDVLPSGLALTVKGGQLLDGIEPSACSGWHMGGTEPHADRRRGRSARRRH